MRLFAPLSEIEAASRNPILEPDSPLEPVPLRSEPIEKTVKRMFSGSPRPDKLFADWVATQNYDSAYADGLIQLYRQTLQELEQDMAAIVMDYAKVFMSVEYIENLEYLACIWVDKKHIALRTTLVDDSIRKYVLEANPAHLDAMRGLVFHEIAHYLYDPTVSEHHGLTEVYGREFKGKELYWKNEIFNCYIERRITEDFPLADLTIRVKIREWFESAANGNIGHGLYIRIGNLGFISERAYEASRKAFVHAVGEPEADRWDRMICRLLELRDIYKGGTEREECIELTRGLMDFIGLHFPWLEGGCSHGIDHEDNGTFEVGGDPSDEPSDIPVEIKEEIMAAFRQMLDEPDQSDEPEMSIRSSVLETAVLDLPEPTPSFETTQKIGYQQLASPDGKVSPKQFVDAYNRLNQLLVATSLEHAGTMLGELDLDSVIESATLGYSRPNMFRHTETSSSAHGDMFVVVGYDCSHSMKGVAHHVAAWHTKRLFNKLRIKCAVIAWSETAGVLYAADELSPDLDLRLPNNAGQGTKPSVASELVWGIFSHEPRSQLKLWFNMTDGDWQQGDGTTAVLAEELDVLASLSFLKEGLHADKQKEWRQWMENGTNSMFDGYHMKHLAFSVGAVADHVVESVAMMLSETAVGVPE